VLSNNRFVHSWILTFPIIEKTYKINHSLLNWGLTILESGNKSIPGYVVKDQFKKYPVSAGGYIPVNKIPGEEDA